MDQKLKYLPLIFLNITIACDTELDSKTNLSRLGCRASNTDSYFEVVHLTCEQTEKDSVGKEDKSNHEWAEFSCGTRKLNESRSYDYDVTSIQVGVVTSDEVCSHNSITFSYDHDAGQATYTGGSEPLICFEVSSGGGNTAEPCTTVREKEGYFRGV